MRHIVGAKQVGSSAVLATRCPFCGNDTILIVPAPSYDAWIGGADIQQAFPNLTADLRECLITGICPACFPPDPEE